jgi:drug/metabolite transporter (DMT)-like permease
MVTFCGPLYAPSKDKTPIANALFVYAVRNGRLDVATILSAFYPAVTVLCARFILNERVSRRQTAGIAAALIAVPLIAAH